VLLKSDRTPRSSPWKIRSYDPRHLRLRKPVTCRYSPASQKLRQRLLDGQAFTKSQSIGNMGTKQDFQLDPGPALKYHFPRWRWASGHVIQGWPEPTGERWCNKRGTDMKFVTENKHCPGAQRMKINVIGCPPSHWACQHAGRAQINALRKGRAARRMAVFAGGCFCAPEIWTSEPQNARVVALTYPARWRCSPADYAQYPRAQT